MKKIVAGKHEILVDDLDYDFVSGFVWSVYEGVNTKYAYRKDRRRVVQMHRAIADAPEGMEVDHKNGNGLDNRRDNLRVCTRTQNAQNRGSLPKRALIFSQYKGVYWQRNAWQTKITADGHTVNIGNFEQEKDAALAYDAISKLLHAEFSNLNFPKASDEERAVALAKKRTRVNKSGFRGVIKVSNSTYRASIRPTGMPQDININGFPTAEEAARAYDGLARKFFGDAAKLNFPDEQAKGTAKGMERGEKKEKHHGSCNAR